MIYPELFARGFRYVVHYICMPTKNTLKLVKNLHHKKYRDEHMLCIAEGVKSVVDTLHSTRTIHSLFVTKDFFDEYKKDIELYKSGTLLKTTELKKRKQTTLSVEIVEQGELQIMSAFQHATSAIAIIHIPETKKDEVLVDIATTSGITLLIDDIQDPGNLGTIIRTAEWYGIRHILVSPNTVDPYNPKVISATMGSFSRMHVTTINPTEALHFFKAKQIKSIGSFLPKEKSSNDIIHNIYTIELPFDGILVVGNESRGISDIIAPYIDIKITIPRAKQHNVKITSTTHTDVESLNVSVATGIILDIWTRPQ